MKDSERYFEMLHASGALHHEGLFAPLVLDASDPRFRDNGLSMVSGFGFIGELEAT